MLTLLVSISVLTAYSARGEGEHRPSHWGGPEDEHCIPAHQPADALLSVGLTHGVTATDVLMGLSGDEIINPRLLGFASVISGNQEPLLTNTLAHFMCFSFVSLRYPFLDVVMDGGACLHS